MQVVLCCLIVLFCVKIGIDGGPLSQTYDTSDVNPDESEKIFDGYNNVMENFPEEIEKEPNEKVRYNRSPFILEKSKRRFKMKVYYDVVVQNDGSVLLIPKDINRGHYFIG
jgi:hypothetical protein